MERAVVDGAADLVGLSRPLIRRARSPPALPGRHGGGGNLRELQPLHRDDGTAVQAAALSLEEGDRAGNRGRPPEDVGRDGDLLPHGAPGTPARRRALSPRDEPAFGHVPARPARAAEAGFAVAAPDQRGRGRSTNHRWRRGDLHSVDRVLDDLDELRKDLGRSFDGLPVFVVGISMGSIIAQMYARRRQASLAGVVLVGPPFGAPQGISRPLLAMSGLLAAAAPRLALRPAPSSPTSAGYGRSRTSWTGIRGATTARCAPARDGSS